MSLFVKPKRRHPRNRAQGALPARLQRLNVLCHRTHCHALPVQMQTAGYRVSPKWGTPVKVFRCPICRVREDWVLDFYTGLPRRFGAPCEW